MRDVVQLLNSSNFTTENRIWYKSPLGTFHIGVEGADVVYFDHTMDRSVIIPHDVRIKSIKEWIIREILDA